ncbi:hypothetical protein [Stenotrophomonas sp. C1657]|nr:hypothetical protein [Stenotrophomonas sp. C1657]MDV3513554.1 hypothetical protein [Stenotrophomonas sp. C1657]
MINFNYESDALAAVEIEDIDDATPSVTIITNSNFTFIVHDPE